MEEDEECFKGKYAKNLGTLEMLLPRFDDMALFTEQSLFVEVKKDMEQLIGWTRKKKEKVYETKRITRAIYIIIGVSSQWLETFSELEYSNYPGQILSTNLASLRCIYFVPIYFQEMIYYILQDE